jgi:CheY-like chemotaxis protein
MKWDGQPHLQEVRILLVDDDIDTLDMFSAYLRIGGATVDTATSVEEALARLSNRPQIIVTDLNVPGYGVDGCGLLYQIRSTQDDYVGNIPAIAITGQSDHEVRTQANLLGFQKVLIKPFPPEELALAIQGLVPI